MGRANICATHFSYITDESSDRVSNDLRVIGKRIAVITP